jgi:membrane-bound lytic murein transglycosylase D
MPRRYICFFSLGFAFLWLAGCAPRYTATVVEPSRDAVPLEVQAALKDASSVYEGGVDFFVKGNYDSAATYLKDAISLLSQNLEWAVDGAALSERRLLLYKCRYFLERIPSVPAEVSPEAEFAAVQPLKPQLPPIEILDNDKVQKWIRYFSIDSRDHFQTWINRSGRYRPATLRILKEEGMPLELTNLAMIESGFNPRAYSRAHAAGIWQFIKSTGKLYGLRVDSYVDERRDPVKSCRAAARHLRDLYEMFNDWPLALAAYNSGAGNVERAIKRNRTTDYWRLSLKRETRDYVPMFMAAATIMCDPASYGFTVEYEPPLEYREVQIEGRTDFKAIARSCRVEPAVISDLNPHLVKHCTPDYSGSYTVRVPKDAADSCLAALAQIPREERIAKPYAAEDVSHTVRQGETLSRIAKRYGTTVAAIAEANGIKDFRALRIGQVLAIPGAEYSPPPENAGIHTVKKGETLSGVAAKYGVHLRDLEAWNDLAPRHTLYPGQKLIVTASKAPQDRVIVHKVKRGDTINGIAQKYGSTTGRLLKTNGLKPTDRIYPGQKIKVPVRS